MADYEEFRIEISPSLRVPGNWDITLTKCPIAGLQGDKGTSQPTFTRTQLRRLRNRNDWPRLSDMELIGKTVWESVMTARASAALEANLEFLKAQNQANKAKGMRITMVMLGEEGNLDPGNGIRLSELPVEALCKDLQFLATDLYTPISRTLQFDPTHDPFPVVLPLRILVVVASPSDKPPANAQEEAQAIRDSLAHLSGPGGPVEVEFCIPPTRDELKKRLAKPFHILHFIGHGGFKQDNDVLQTPYISLVRPDVDKSDNINAGDLTTLLKNTEIRLLVFTSCSSAAPTPDEEPYRIGAFEGLAQRLLSGVSDVSAAVAMQFDMESEAAVNFTRVFYENLLRPDMTLDEVVTLARKELATNARFGTGHRAWVTPMVYWRCKGGKVFNLDTISIKPSQETLEQLQDLQGQIKSLRRILSDMANEPPQIREFLAPLINKHQGEVENLQAQRAQLLGESIRLRGASVKPNEEFDGRLTLRVRVPGVIDLIKVFITYQPDKIEFVSAATGVDSPGNNPLVGRPNPGELEVAVLNPSNGSNWAPKEYEVGLLKFRPAAGLTPGILDLPVRVLEIRRGGQRVASVQALDAVVFINDAK